MPNILNLYGNAFISTGDKKFGSSSLSLNGSGDFAQIEITNDFSLADSNYCIEGFFNFDEIKTGKNILISKEDNEKYDYRLYYDGTSSGIFWDIYGLSTVVSGRADLIAGQWYHIAATRESDHHYLWLDMDNYAGVSGDINVGTVTSDKLMIGHSVDPENVTKTTTINGATFALTTKKYKHGYEQDDSNSANNNIENELGSNWAIASWEDFKNFSESELQSLLQAFDIDTSSTSDNWVGWLTNSSRLNHFSTSKESKRFNRCYFLAFHNKSSQSDFEYFDDYHSKYCALGSWISELPYIVKKISNPSQVSKGYQDFNGFVDGLRMSKDSFRYCVNCFGNNNITKFFDNDPYTSLLLDFEGAHGSKSVIDLSSTDILINRPPVQIDSIYPITGSKDDLMRISGKALNSVTHIHLSGKNGEKLYIPKKGSLSASVNTNYPKFVNDGSTGIYFKLPESVKDNEYFTAVNINNITDTSDTNIVFEQNVSSERFRIGNPRINSFSPARAVYGESVNVNGTKIENDTKFFFRGYPTGSNRNEVVYVPPLQTSVLSYTGATITVPREIIAGSIYISGDGEISKSEETFTPLPTISGYEPKNLTIGSTYRVTGINASQAYPLLFITGTSSDLYYSNNGVDRSKAAIITRADLFDLSSYNQEETFLALPSSRNLSAPFDLSSMGDSKLFFSGGCTILTGTITRQFVGTGNLFLSNYEDEKVRDVMRNAANFDKLQISPYLNSVTGESVVVKEVAPSGSFSLHPNRGNSSTLVSLSGRYMLNITGLEIRDVTANTKCSIAKSDFNNTKNRTESVSFDEQERGVYRVVVDTPGVNSYHQKHAIDFYPCNLSSGNSGDLYLLTPNYVVKV